MDSIAGVWSPRRHPQRSGGHGAGSREGWGPYGIAMQLKPCCAPYRTGWRAKALRMDQMPPKWRNITRDRKPPTVAGLWQRQRHPGYRVHGSSSKAPEASFMLRRCVGGGGYCHSRSLLSSLLSTHISSPCSCGPNRKFLQSRLTKALRPKLRRHHALRPAVVRGPPRHHPPRTSQRSYQPSAFSLLTQLAKRGGQRSATARLRAEWSDRSTGANMATCHRNRLGSDRSGGDRRSRALLYDRRCRKELLGSICGLLGGRRRHRANQQPPRCVVYPS